MNPVDHFTAKHPVPDLIEDVQPSAIAVHYPRTQTVAGTQYQDRKLGHIECREVERSRA